MGNKVNNGICVDIGFMCFLVGLCDGDSVGDFVGATVGISVGLFTGN